jgi:hypothetical protein
MFDREKMLVIVVGCLRVGNLNILMLEEDIRALSLVGTTDLWFTHVVGILYQV